MAAGGPILMLLPASDYDPTESAVPWAALRQAGCDVRFATPTGAPAYADERLVAKGFGPLSPMLMTKRPALDTYREMTGDPAFNEPQRYEDVDPDAVQGLVVPGGHAEGVKTLYDSPQAQEIARQIFTSGKPVGAVCHGVLLLARTTDPSTGRSVLYGRKTTALTAALELSGWLITAPFLGSYYRTYDKTVQAEVTAALASKRDFRAGPPLPIRDSPAKPQRGFAVRDGNYVSARWPGDCYRFAQELVEVVRTAAPAVKVSA